MSSTGSRCLREEMGGAREGPGSGLETCVLEEEGTEEEGRGKGQRSQESGKTLSLEVLDPRTPTPQKVDSSLPAEGPSGLLGWGAVVGETPWKAQSSLSGREAPSPWLCSAGVLSH